MKKLLMIVCAVLFVAACGADGDVETPVGDKPAANPDAELTGKADRLSNWYTEIRGELVAGEVVEGEIGYPDWFHGYTVELEAGTTQRIRVQASAEGLVRLYGPSIATYSNGRPYFTRAAHRGNTAEELRGYHVAEFEFEVERSGTYLVVYGPRYVWNANYDVLAGCVAGCEVDTTVESLLEEPSRYDGMQVNVQGWVNLGYVACTRMACTPENACCNRCHGALNLHADEGTRQGGIALTEEDIRYACSGDNCNPEATCSVEPGEYRIGGIFTINQWGEPSIEVTSREAIASGCTSNDECTDGWCRATDSTSNSRECVPFVGEGESCGGFTLPHMYESCSPELSCVFRPFVADAPGTCRHNVTVAELEANPTEWDGVRVNIDGHIQNEPAICTQMACPPENPCCNQCGAGQVLVDGASATGASLVLEQNGETFACGGNNCDYDQNCTVDPTGKYRVVGVFRTGQYQNMIEVESYERLEY